MGTYGWLVVIGVILILIYLWSKYGALYMLAQNNPGAVHAGQSIARYATDIEGLIGAYDAQNNTNGSFMSRLGSFFGALPS